MKEDGKVTVNGEAYAKKWKDGRYTEYEVTLIFWINQCNRNRSIKQVISENVTCFYYEKMEVRRWQKLKIVLERM